MGDSGARQAFRRIFAHESFRMFFPGRSRADFLKKHPEENRPLDDFLRNSRQSKGEIRSGHLFFKLRLTPTTGQYDLV